MSLERITKSMQNFLADADRSDIDHSASWQKLRSDFLELGNKKIVLELNPETSKLINQIHNTKGFGDILTDDQINRVFPSLKYKYHLVKTPGEPTKAIKIRAPSYAAPQTARMRTKNATLINSFLNNTLETPTLTLKPIDKGPKTARFKTVKLDPDNKEPMKPFPDELPPPKPTITELIPTLKVDDSTQKILDEAATPRKRWVNGFTLENERDAIKYVAAVDSKNDFLQFHFGKEEKANQPFSFDVANQIKGRSNENFNTVTKRGVVKAETQGHSEFTPLHQYVENKTQFEMLRPISLFAQFKLYKYLHFWHILTIRKLFSKRLYRFADVCWSAKPQYPGVITQFRQHLLLLHQMNLFPFKTVGGELGFKALQDSLAEARDDTYRIISNISSEIRVVLNNLSKELNEYYEYITSPRATDYLEMKKIPAELFMAAKMPFKHGQSIVEAKEQKKKHEQTVALAKHDLDALPAFLLMCDKMVIQLFLEIVTKQFKEFVKVFTDANHDVLMRTFIIYESETLMFSPSYRELTMMFNEHLDSLYDLFRSFIRPCMVDPKGSGKFLDYKLLKVRLDDIIKRDPNYSSCLTSFNQMIELAYKEAKDTFNLYFTPAITVFKFRDNWPEMKVKETDPTIYINNLNDLTHLQEKINDLRMNSTHQFLIVDTKQLRSNLLDILSSTIEENNSILFRNFEQICKDIVLKIRDIVLTLQEPNETLESQAEFNLAINKAKQAAPQIDANVQVVDSIFARAKEMAKLLVPILVTSLDEMHESYNRFKMSLEFAQNKMNEIREQTIATLVEQQKALEERMNQLDKRTKAEFSTVEVTVSPETAIADLLAAIEKANELKSDIRQFESTATRLNYSDYDFSQIQRTKIELEQSLGNWQTYQAFMNEINGYLDTNVMEVKYPQLIHFLNSHNEREMRSANHPLFDKMAASYSNLYQYLQFFQIITKIELTEDHWTEIGKILELSYEKLLDMKLERFLSPRLLNNMEHIKSYILNLQQRADLSQSFDGMILDMRALILRLTDSTITKTKLITFPSIHEAMNTCEHFILYLHSLESSQFYTTIQKQAEMWMSKLKMSLNILHAISQFQTKFVYFCTATVSSFCITHFPTEYHYLRFILDFYKTFIDQLELDPHVLSLMPNLEQQAVNPKRRGRKQPPQEIPSNMIDKVIDNLYADKKYSSTNPKTSTYKLQMLASEYQIEDPSTSVNQVVNKDITKPIGVGEIALLKGDTLIKYLNEAQSRCEILLNSISHLLDIQRQKFPRFYFCTDQQILEILLACSNVKYLADDLLPVFPALSRFHVSIVDTARIMGIINTNGETYQFSRDFDYEFLPAVDLLARTETEMKFSVRSTILDALSSREYTEPVKWLIRFPVQAVMVAESIHFSANVIDFVHKSTAKPDLNGFINEVGEFITTTNDFIKEYPQRIEQLSALIGMKIRHRDILQELNDSDVISVDGFSWKRHMFHVIKQDKGVDQVYMQIGSFQIPYGYEMLSKMDIGLMTSEEEAAALALASCATETEFSICKQLNGHRNIVKTFADSCGFPIFDVPTSCLRNVFAGASAMHAVIRLREVKELPATFPNFFGIIEAKMKIMKCENSFREFDRSNWCCLIHLDEEEVPSWLKQRLRPITLAFEPPSEILMRLNQIRKEFHFPEDTPIDDALNAIQKQKGIDFITRLDMSQSLHKSNLFNEDIEMKQIKVFFNLPEYILTGKFKIVEDPIMLNVPPSFEEAINELGEIIEKFDTISPHSQSPDCPIRPFPVHITCLSSDRLSTVLTIMASFRESIKFVRPQLSFVSNTRIELGMIGYRPVIFNIIEEKDLTAPFLIKMPVLTPKNIFDMMIQHPEYGSLQDDIMSFGKEYLDNSLQSKTDNETINDLITKLNLMRKVYGSENSIQMTHLSESIFTGALHLANISDDDLLTIPLNYDLSIVIKGPISSGKRTYAKKYITKYASPQDLVFYSSPFNETLSMTIMDNVKFIARGIYGPPETKRIFLCIFDYQLAIPSIRDFVIAYMLHHSVYSSVEEKYVVVERLVLIVTTTDDEMLFNLNCPFYSITQFESPQVDFSKLPSNIINNDLSAAIQQFTTEERRFLLASKMIAALNTDSTFANDMDRFLILFSLFYSDEHLKSIAQMCNTSFSQIKHIQCHNQNLADSMSDTNLCSRIIEVLNMGMNMILIHNDTKIFQYIKNTEFVVLNSHFRTQFFSAMVKVSQNKKRTTFLLNMKMLTIPEMFNLLDFFLFNKESPESSMIFDAPDLQIFKHYMDPRGEEQNTIPKLLDLVSFIILCDENDYKEIPDVFRTKMVTLRYQNCEELQLKQSERPPFVESLLPYVSLPTRTFNDLVTAQSKKYRERFQEFIDETQFIIEFFSTLTSMRSKVENQAAVVIVESESELKSKMEQLDSKITEAKNKKSEFDDQLKAKTDELSVLQAKINVQVPNEVSTAIAAICSFSLDEQVDQINQWLSTKDEFYIFVNIFKNFFHFITPANFTDSVPNSTFCKLVTSIRQYNLADNNSSLSQKLPGLGLQGESPAVALLNRITLMEDNKIPTISPIPIVNAILTWLSIVVKYCGLEEEMTEVSMSLTQLRTRNNTNDEKLMEMQMQYDDLSTATRQKATGMDVPSWLLQAWNKDESDVTRFMNQLDDIAKSLMRIVSSSVNAEKLINSYSALSIAYKYGFSELPQNERREFLKTCKMEHLFDPFSFIEKGAEIEIFFPVTKLLSMFSPDIHSETMQAFSTMQVFDQIVFSDIIEHSSRFFQNKIDSNRSLLPHPINVFYDPNDVTLQTLLTNYPKSHVAFSSSKIQDALFNAITDGSTLIVHIDSVESGKEFFSTALHFILHYNATNDIQFGDVSKPLNKNFKMFCLTKIHPNEFKSKLFIDRSDIVFTDMSISKPHETQWFELSAVFAVNPQIETFFIELFESISTKIVETFVNLRKLSELSHDTWPEYFSNPQKQISLRSLLDTMMANQESLDNSINAFKSIIKPNGDHPQAISRYSPYTSLLRDLCNDLVPYIEKESNMAQSSNSQLAYQIISSVRNFTKNKDRGPMAPISTVNTFQEMMFDVLNILSCKHRLQFQAKFENERLKGVATNTHLLFDASFPKLSERPIAPLLPQLISHVASRFPTIPRQFFAFVTPDIVPFPKKRPVIVVVDSAIPTDFYSRSISQHLPKKKLMLLTIGSFSNPGLTSPEAFYNIIQGCKSRNALFLVNYDELMPDFTIPAIIHYAHLLEFVNFYIIINEENFYSKSMIPLISNAIICKISKPYTLNGSSRLISLFPSFRAENMKYEIPLLYLLFLLWHRNDFILKTHQILPFAMDTRELWALNQFQNPILRNYWKDFVTSLALSLTSDVVLRKSYRNIFSYFFNESTPSIPGMQRVDFENDTILSSEYPPNPAEIGRVIEEDESPFARPHYNWKNSKELAHLFQYNEIAFKIGQPAAINENENDKIGPFSSSVLLENSIQRIKHCEVVNGRMNFENGEISVLGSKYVDVYVYEKNSNHSQDENIENEEENDFDEIPIMDGSEELGFVKVKRPGNQVAWSMAGVKIILPDFKTAEEYESE